MPIKRDFKTEEVSLPWILLKGIIFLAQHHYHVGVMISYSTQQYLSITKEIIKFPSSLIKLWSLKKKQST